MEFFKSLSGLMKSVDLSIAIRGGENTMTVSILPKSTNKDISTNIKPLIMTGTPEELDLYFLDTITKPLENSIAVIQNVKEYEESVKAEEKALADKKKKSQDTKDKNAKEKADKAKKDSKAVKPATETTTEDKEESDEVEGDEKEEADDSIL